MLRKFAGAVAVAALVVTASASRASAQLPLGYTDIGATIGLGGLGGASLSFGARGERVIKELPTLGGGTLGIGVSLDYYSYSSGIANFKFNYRNIPIGATGNYHFKLTNPKLDAFVGAGLGFNIVTCSYTGVTSSTGCSSSSGLYPIGHAGGRYFFQPNLAAYADVGAGAAAINVGIMLKIR